MRVGSLTLLFAVALSAAGCKGRGESDATALQASAIAHRDKGEYDLAIADLDRAIASSPNLASAFFNRGFVHQLAKRYDRAIQDYDQAIVLKPDYASAINSRGFAYQLKGDYPQAIQNFDHALRVDSNLSVAIRNRGRVKSYLGRFAEAAADLQAGLRRDSSNTFLVVWLHIMRERLGQPDTPDLATQQSHIDPAKWPAPVVRLYAGQLTPAQLDSVANTMGDAKAQVLERCGAAYYIAEYLLWHHEDAEAVTRFKDARANCPNDASEYHASVAELERRAEPVNGMRHRASGVY